jgi:hypothetical protein
VFKVDFVANLEIKQICPAVKKKPIDEAVKKRRIARSEMKKELAKLERLSDREESWRLISERVPHAERAHFDHAYKRMTNVKKPDDMVTFMKQHRAKLAVEGEKAEVLKLFLETFPLADQTLFDGMTKEKKPTKPVSEATKKLRRDRGLIKKELEKLKRIVDKEELWKTIAERLPTADRKDFDHVHKQSAKSSK